MLAANAILFGALFRLVKGIGYIVKGLTLAAESEIVAYTSVLFSELANLIRVEFLLDFVALTKSQWLITIGSIQTALAGFIIYLDAMANNIVYFHFIDKVAEIKIEDKPYKIIPKPFID